MIPFIPMIPLMRNLNYNEKPPTLYSIMNSIANYNKPAEEQTKIRNLAKVTHSKIFDFDYPLDSSVDKEEFECMILNHFIKRRIGTETFTEFQINLEVKLNSIMPVYNKMFNMLYNSGLGETSQKVGNNNNKVNTQNEVNTQTESRTTGTNSQDLTTDSRNSELPQNQLENLHRGSYASNADYTTQKNNSTSNTQDNSNSNQRQNANTTNDTKYDEIQTNTNIVELLQLELKSIYDKLFKDLDDLFYGLV